MEKAELQKLQDDIVAHIKGKDIDLVGFGPFNLLDDVKKVGPEDFNYPTAICMATELPEDVVRGARDRPSEDLREWYKIVNRRMMAATTGLVEMLNEAGFRSRVIHPADRIDKENLMGSVSLKSIARVCGMGFVGKNGLILTDEFGPRQRFLVVLTDMPLLEIPDTRKCECGECRECIDHCAMKVLNDQTFTDHPPSRDSTIDWRKCSVFENKLIGDGSRPEKACGKCMAHCPRSYE